ncbi:MAG: ATP-binding protein [Bryobacteraceae bacterium]
MPTLSIRQRLTGWYAVVLVLGLSLFGAGMWFALQERLMAGTDARLAQRIQGLQTVIEVESAGRTWNQLRVELSEFAREVPDGALIQLRDASGKRMLPIQGDSNFVQASFSSKPEYSTVNRNGGWYRILTARIGYGGQTYDALVASSLDEVQSVMGELRNLLLLMVPVVLAIACWGGYWISGRALRPVDEITRVARSISVQNLSHRLRVPQTGDELQRMSETWNEVLERLDGAIQRIRQFTADASHELRTPMSLIRATSELALRRERTPEEYRKSLRNIEVEAKRMTDLTESLLRLARADAGVFEMPLSETDLNQIVTEVVQHNADIAGAKGLALTAELTGKPALVTANEAGIRRLLLILTDNALKHTHTGGAVTISTISSGDELMLAVRDTGDGIPAEALPHVFERFFRVDTARGSGSGVGLGLSIAQAIAHAHGAEIKAESQPGAGARFSLCFKM